jgi:hemoglobin
MQRTIAASMLAGGLLLSLAGCNTMESGSGKMMADKSLYDRLGGKPAITAVVDDFVGRVAADSRINGKFANANIPRLKTMLVDQICQASGGPCTYSGRDMKAAHAGMGVTGEEFDALVGDLVATLNKFKVGEREKNDLLGALGPMKKDIVTSPTASGPDGRLPLPVDYKSWPKFLMDIPKGEAKQVRDIYINPTGARTSAGQDFPNGTVMVMEIYKAKMDGDKIATGMDGKPVKGDLAKVFVMGKEQGWGNTIPDNLKNGDWAYAAYDASSKPLMEDFTKCRACHAPLAQKDFVHRYDEYFEKRGRAGLTRPVGG